MADLFIIILWLCRFFTFVFLLVVFIKYLRKSNRDNFEESRINWIKIIVISSGELALTLFVFCYYPVISMLCFGEGGGSWLYSRANSVGWAVMPVFIPTIINLRNVFRAVENENSGKLQTFKLIELIVVILYLPVIVVWYLTNGFRI